MGSFVQRLAVLLAAGLSPRSAWQHCASGSSDHRLMAVAARIAAGDDLMDALDAVILPLSGHTVAAGDDDQACWASLAAAWRVASTSGAPLAPALRTFADGLRDRATAQRDIRVALAGPRSTARIVVLLPGVAALLAGLMGVDIIGAVSTPIGAFALVSGLALIVIARRWMRSLLRAASPPAPTIGLALDLLAVAAAGGGAPERAGELVGGALQRAHPALAAAGEFEGDLSAISELVWFSRTTGAPLGELARTEAAEQRSRARSRAQETAAELGVRLMLPLGLCVLPSFVLLGVAPMVIGLLSSTTGAA